MKAYTDISIPLRIPRLSRQAKVALFLGALGACGAVIAGNPIVNKPGQTTPNTNVNKVKVYGNLDFTNATR